MLSRKYARDNNGTTADGQSCSQGLRNRLEACEELRRCFVPSKGRSVLRANTAVEVESRAYGHSKIVVKDACHTLLDHIDGTRNGKSGNRDTAGQRLDHRKTECVGQTRKNQNIRASKHAPQLPTKAIASERRLGMTRGQLGALRPIANYQLRPWHPQVEKGVDVLFDSQPAAVRHDGTRQTGKVGVRWPWLELLQVHASTPEV